MTVTCAEAGIGIASNTIVIKENSTDAKILACLVIVSLQLRGCWGRRSAPKLLPGNQTKGRASEKILPPDLSLKLGLPANLTEMGNPTSDKVRLFTGRSENVASFRPFLALQSLSTALSTSRAG
jgi:hypothetical protein